MTTRCLETFCGASGLRLVVASAGVTAMLAAASAAAAQDLTAGGEGEAHDLPFTIGKVFTFLFVTLGPFNVLAPFSSMTRGCDQVFKRRLALEGTSIAAIALAVAATLGAMILHSWGVSAEALMLTGGIILFLVALRVVLKQYAPRESPSEAPKLTAAPVAPSSLAFSPLAFPTIVTPYGVAVLVLLVRLRGNHLTIAGILTMTAVVLVLDLLAMLFADRILKAPFVASALSIVGAVMGVLQVALGIEVIVIALRLLGVVETGGA